MLIIQLTQNYLLKVNTIPNQPIHQHGIKNQHG